MREDIDDRNAGRGQFEPGPPVGTARRHHDPVDPLSNQRLDVLRLAQGIVGGVAHEHRHAAVGQAFFEALHDRNGEAAETVGRYEADRQAVAAMETLGEIVWTESQLLGDGNDLVAGLLSQIAVLVESLGDGADADLGEAGDVVNGRPDGPPPLLRCDLSHCQARFGDSGKWFPQRLL